MSQSAKSFLDGQMLRQVPPYVHLAVPLVLLLPILMALLPGGLPNSADGMVHFSRISEIADAWRAGIWVPRWSLNLGFGYGVPVFIFGPPLVYWLGAFFDALGLGPDAAYKAMLITVLLVGASGAYRLGQVLLGVWAGVLATVAFAYAPNQLFTLFVQGNAPQLLAWGLLPWALWATIQINRAQLRREQLAFALVLAATVGGALISHNVVALILVPTVAALEIILWVATHHHTALGMTTGGGAMGGAMGAWFAVPALLESAYASTDAIVASDYRSRFVSLGELLAWPIPTDAGAINPYIPRTLGLPIVAVALIGVIFFLGWRLVLRPPSRLLREKYIAGQLEDKDAQIFWGTAIFMVLYAFFCGWMTTRWSAPLWEHLPLLEFLQFPARWIGFATLGLAWLAAAAVGLMSRRAQPLFAAALTLFLLISALVNLYPDRNLPDLHVFSANEVVRYEVKSGAIGTTSYGEFNPRWAPRPLPASPMVDDYLAHRPVDRLEGVLPAGASHRTLRVTAHHQSYAITLPAPTVISLNLLYFPGWTAAVNRAPAEIWPHAQSGLVTLAMPAGESVLEVNFGPTPLRRAVGALSSVAWGGFALLLVGLMLHAPRTSALPSPVISSAELRQAGPLLAMVSVVVGVTLVLQTVRGDWFLLHSPPDSALAAPVQRYDELGDHFRLLGQNPLPTTVRAGATLPVVAYWRALVEMDKNYAAVLEVVDVASGQILVEKEQTHPNDIPTSGWAMGLYVRNEWQVAIPANALPMQYALRIGFRHPTTGAWLPTADNGTAVELGRLWVLPQVDAVPSNGPRTQFGASLELVGARTEGDVLTLYWRANAPLSESYSIFVHLLDANGAMVGQMDGLPFANRYPTWAWQPGQIIEDRRNLAASGLERQPFDRVALGVYDPITGTRLTAIDQAGQRLLNDAVIVEWARTPD